MLRAEQQYFKNLDGLRFLCFLSVFTVHSLHTDDLQIQSTFLYKVTVEGLFAHGGLGVNFFFVLSGYLITYLLIFEKQTTGKINILHFWWKRIIRIWPLYFVCIIFGFFIFPYIKGAFGERVHETADLKLYLLFLSNFDIIRNGWPDSTELGVLWSIAIEEQFYLVWPILLYLVPVNRFWTLFLGIIVISLTFRTFHDNEILYYYHTLSCISDMAIGGLGAWLIHHSAVKEKIVSLSQTTIVLIYLAFAVCFVFKDQLFSHFLFTRVFERLTISILIILIILEQNYSINSFYKMGKYKRLSELGITTYGMYMLHIIAIIVVVTTFEYLKIFKGGITIMIIGPLLGLMLSIWLSKLSYNHFEKKFLGLRRFLK